MATSRIRDKYTTIPSPTNAHAFIGNQQVNHTFRFNPDTVEWDYQENIVSMDTIGGRVIQLLSISMNGITINGRAGNRGELQRMATNIKSVMGYQVNTLNPVHFKVPSRNWDFVGYVIDIPDLGWNHTATSYPYQINFAVEDDVTGLKTKQISNEVITRIKKDIGYSPHMHGGDSQKFYDIIEAVSKNSPLSGAEDDGLGIGGGIGVGSNITFPLRTTQSGANFSRNDHPYKATDIFDREGTQWIACVDGKIDWADDPSGCSSYDVPKIQIAGNDGQFYYYTHGKPGSITVRSGQSVKAGDSLGQIGPSACAQGTSPHLHFQIKTKSEIGSCSREGGCPGDNFNIDPYNFLLNAFKTLPR